MATRTLSKEPIFYVYMLRRPYGDMSPCYVGKGKGFRYRDHFVKGIKHRNSHLARIFAKSLEMGQDVILDIIAFGLTEEEALNIEKMEIAEIGRSDEKRPNRKVGTLCNHTDGGDGHSGGFLSDELKAAISKVHKGVPKTGLKAKGMPATGRNAKGHKRPEQGAAMVGVPKTGNAAKGMPKGGMKAKGIPATGKSAKGCRTKEVQDRMRETWFKNHPEGRVDMIGNKYALGYKFTPEQLKKTAEGKAKAKSKKLMGC